MVDWLYYHWFQVGSLVLLAWISYHIRAISIVTMHAGLDIRRVERHLSHIDDKLEAEARDRRIATD